MGLCPLQCCFCFYAVSGNAKTQLGWVRGLGRHGGEAPALCVGTDDVGLDSSVTSHQGEGREKRAAAIDPKPTHRPAQG